MLQGSIATCPTTEANTFPWEQITREECVDILHKTSQPRRKFANLPGQALTGWPLPSSTAQLPGAALSLPAPEHRALRLPRQKTPSPSSWLARPSTALNAQVCCNKVLVCRRHNAPALPLQSCTPMLPGADNAVYPTITQLPVVHTDFQAQHMTNPCVQEKRALRTPVPACLILSHFIYQEVKADTASGKTRFAQKVIISQAI